MEVIMYIAFFILFVACGYLVYQYGRLERVIKEQNKIQKKELVDAGNAITETLKIAFDNLKKLSNKQDKNQNEFNQILGRIHRIEQKLQRIRISDEDINSVIAEETKNERRKPKAD